MTRLLTLYSIFICIVIVINLIKCQPIDSDAFILIETSTGFLPDFYITPCNEYSYFKVEMTDPCLDLNIQCDPTMYVAKTQPNDPDSFPSKDKLTWSTSREKKTLLTISHWDTESSPGWYYIAVHGQCTKGNNAAAQFKIEAFESIDENNDLAHYSFLGMNQKISANQYKFFQFCVPFCADVVVNIENCVDPAVCPDSYAYPQLVVSRSQKTPKINSHAFKLGSRADRNILIEHTDPSALDRNGFNQGVFYVGVYGWCSSDPAQKAPCSLVDSIPFNISLELNFLNPDQCSASNLLYEPSPTDVQTITSGETVIGQVSCNDYKYYQIEVLDPCENFNIFLGNSADPSKTPYLVVGKWPNLTPRIDDMEWISYNNGYQNLTISAWDPDFDGGYVCGLKKNELCKYTIGVFGSCTGDQTLPFQFTLIAKLSKAFKIYNQPQIRHGIAPYQLNRYQFCVRSNKTDVAAQLLSWTSSYSCPNSYANLQMVVSKTNMDADYTDYVWRMSATNIDQALIILNSDVNTRAGSYYLNIIGSCVEDYRCTELKSCGPCTNLYRTKYSLVVSDNYVINSTKNVNQYLGVCPDMVVQLAPTSLPVSNPSSSTSVLTTAALAGLLVGLIMVCVIFFIFCFCRYKVTLSLEKKQNINKSFQQFSKNPEHETIIYGDAFPHRDEDDEFISSDQRTMLRPGSESSSPPTSPPINSYL